MLYPPCVTCLAWPRHPINKDHPFKLSHSVSCGVPLNGGALRRSTHRGGEVTQILQRARHNLGSPDDAFSVVV